MTDFIIQKVSMSGHDGHMNLSLNFEFEEV